MGEDVQSLSLALSVIIPVRNRAADLERAVRALLRSETPPLEILIVDDGSWEPLPAIVQHPCCRVIRLDGKHGSYFARNLAASQARGGILAFIDSDVCVNAETLGRLRRRLSENENLAAVFGKYDQEPAARTFVSQYRNLLHTFMHQTSNPDAHTFWTGCGAIRRRVFEEFGGFATDRMHLRDIELGVRLSQAGRPILLDRTIEVTHLKRWTLRDVVRTDIFFRGANWTEICLRNGGLPNDLNTRMGERASVVLVYLMILCVPAAVMWGSKWLWAEAALFAAYLILSRKILAFLVQARSSGFAIRAIPLHVLYHLCCGAGFLAGLVQLLRRPGGNST
ncbi:MAG TPA: glycosyltransferase family 2 protein [Bryobacteraceae bacterium]|nr:glycosyltransferase family 2 protein [Bryobacteraceae bacterium]